MCGSYVGGGHGVGNMGEGKGKYICFLCLTHFLSLTQLNKVEKETAKKSSKYKAAVVNYWQLL